MFLLYNLIHMLYPEIIFLLLAVLDDLEKTKQQEKFSFFPPYTTLTIKLILKSPLRFYLIAKSTDILGATAF